MPMPPNFRVLGRSSALAARTSKVDSNGRVLLKFDVELAAIATHYHGEVSKMRKLHIKLQECTAIAIYFARARS